MTDLLSKENGMLLVKIARRVITDHLDGKKLDLSTTDHSELRLPLGVFVTLLEERNRELRGCIGNPFPRSSVLNETSHCAIEAATMDPRFSPITRDEFVRQTILEVTVLSPLEYLFVKSPLDLPLNLKVGRDGLLVEGEGARGLLLPQIAVDEEFGEEEFLSECCLKAGLMPDAWVTGRIRVARFQGQIFSEEEPGGPVLERKLKG